MTVYIVGFADSDDGLKIEAVFSTREAAENKAAGYWGHKPSVEEWDVDD